MAKYAQGFTLVELAIVLVIIGLLTGRVLQGQELIKQAQIRNAINKLTEIDTAANAFRVKYNELPGDMTKATAFGLNFEPGTATSNTARTNSATDNNGDGDGLLKSWSIATFLLGGYATHTGEIKNFPIMLSNAGLIKDSLSERPYCTAGPSPNCNAVAGAHIPTIKIGNMLVTLSAMGSFYHVLGFRPPADILYLTNNSTTAAQA